MRPEYGSRLFELLDAPVNRTWKVECYAAVAEALDRWEPRLQLSRVNVQSVSAGQVIIDLYGTYLPTGEPLTLEGLIL